MGVLMYFGQPGGLSVIAVSFLRLPLLSLMRGESTYQLLRFHTECQNDNHSALSVLA